MPDIAWIVESLQRAAGRNRLEQLIIHLNWHTHGPDHLHHLTRLDSLLPTEAFPNFTRLEIYINSENREGEVQNDIDRTLAYLPSLKAARMLSVDHFGRETLVLFDSDVLLRKLERNKR